MVSYFATHLNCRPRIVFFSILCGLTWILPGAFPALVMAAIPPAQESSVDQHKVIGAISDQSGSPLPRTLVEVRDSRGDVAASTQTNSRGEFTFNLPDGNYTVTATLAGFLPLNDRPMAVTDKMSPLRLKMEIPSMEVRLVVTATNT